MLIIVLYIILLVAPVLASYLTGKLTLAAALTGGLIAAAIYSGAGFNGIILLAAFFLLAVLATSWKKDQKKHLTPGRLHPEKRDAWQVLANGSMAAVMGLLMYAMPLYSETIGILLAASLAAATADTLSSELGTVYGKRFYHIINFKRGEKGKDGVISLEGTLAGLIGSVIIALIYNFGFGRSQICLWIIIAGTAGNLADSVMGATLERKGYLSNNGVNFLNTVFACFIAWLLLII